MKPRDENKQGHSGGAGGFGVEQEVLDRYAQSAGQFEQSLCCPADGHDPALLKLLPDEIIEKDYGCGNPAPYARPGDTVVDLGSGVGKMCYILAQKVGPEGRVIGVDFNDAMLEVARKYEDEMAERIGYRNVSFRKGRIQDLALDMDKAGRWLAANPIEDVNQLAAFNDYCRTLRREQPMIADGSVDLIVSNCVLNLVETGEKAKLFTEMARVLKPGGRAVISDIVCDEDPTPAILADPKLWSGCISGAFGEDRFLRMFEEAGFHGMEILARGDEPWRIIDGIEFRSMTVRAWRDAPGPCLDRRQAVVFTGPWKQVRDDEGHIYRRGERMAVCDRTYRMLTDPDGPYAAHMIGIEPAEPDPLDEAPAFDCHSGVVRTPGETKGTQSTRPTVQRNAACGPGHCC